MKSKWIYPGRAHSTRIYQIHFKRSDYHISLQKIINATDFTALVHTVQLSTNGIGADLNAIAALRYVKDNPCFRQDRFRIIINPNKYRGTCRSAHEVISVLNAIISELELEDFDLMIDRIDVAIDTDMDYDILWKPMNYLKALCGFHWKKRDNAYRAIGDDLKKRSTLLRTDSRTLEIYNKRLESVDVLAPATRCEFRYTRINRHKERYDVAAAVYKAIADTIATLSKLPQYIPLLECCHTAELVKAYRAELDSSGDMRISSLRDFVVRYSDYIYSRSSLEALNQAGRPVDISNWLRRFRKNCGLAFVHKGNITYLCKKMKCALQVFAGSKQAQCEE